MQVEPRSVPDSDQRWRDHEYARSGGRLLRAVRPPGSRRVVPQPLSNPRPAAAWACPVSMEIVVSERPEVQLLRPRMAGLPEQEQNSFSDVFWIEVLPPRVAHHGVALFGYGTTPEWCEDGPGYDGADLDAIVRNLGCEPLHQPHQPEVRGAVRTELRKALLAGARRDRDDHAAPAGSQVRDGGFGAEKRAGQIGSNGGFPIGDRVRLDRSVAANTGRENSGIDPLQL